MLVLPANITKFQVNSFHQSRSEVTTYKYRVVKIGKMDVCGRPLLQIWSGHNCKHCVVIHYLHNIIGL